MCWIRVFLMNPQMKIGLVMLMLLPMVELLKTKFCNCNPLHVLCDDGMYNPNKRNIIDSPLSMKMAYRASIVKNLNFLRHSVASGTSIFPQASYMQKLRYDGRLERAAEMQVRSCNPWTGFNRTEEWCNHECYKCTDIDGVEVHFAKSLSRVFGRENRFPLIISRLKKPPRSNIFDVYENYKVPSPKDMQAELYEIQYMALQAKYAEVGCSWTTYMDAGHTHYTLLCAFGPVTPGMLDQPLYDAGVPCCQCPMNTKCGIKEFISLCEFEKGMTYNKTEGIPKDGAICRDSETSGEAKP